MAGAELVGGDDGLPAGDDEAGGDDELVVPELPHPAAKAATAVAAAAMTAARFMTVLLSAGWFFARSSIRTENPFCSLLNA
ncbi:hypothetical protein ACIRVK_25385 [Streptomyces sp. NPDC101152]|uniref:hypothetical protein n=1 Tax=Streptomyces sp. NPDC101152 TaxID=3366116 RepID=UPI00382FEA63